MSDEIALSPYDPAWARSFAAEYSNLLACFEKPPLAIEHIGSTSVPGLPSKPIIDILIHVEDRTRAVASIPALEALGYANVPNYIDPNRLVLIKRRSDGERSHHVHVHSDADEVRRHLMFRDRLRSDKAVRDDYAALKAELAQRFQEDRAAYSKHKTAFIDAIVLGMGGPARKTPWNP
ncbi:MAG: GrpB family protein [Devosia sp.]|uniref:GrpB family protein n=1 Tax=Devosia sp. TaxID=1871048 RepID=UPI0024C89F2D|nr:GrpB family protein [Devosia sp.]UYN99102.1 MAG: GrpB family protein [Devosia sp.]